MVDVTIWLALLGGLLSFVSPCVLPLVPAYIGYMSNRVASHAFNTTSAVDVAPSRTSTHRLKMALHGVVFVLGFTFVFVIFGLAILVGARTLSTVVYDFQRNVIPRIGGVLIILFGLHFLGVFDRIVQDVPHRQILEKSDPAGRIIRQLIVRLHSLLNVDTRPQISQRSAAGLVGSALMGVIFAAGWTPCIGPIYGTILTMAVSGNDISTAGALLTAYSLGLGIPFVLIAIGLDQMQWILKRLKRRMNLIKLASGTILIAIGILVFTGDLQRISQIGASNALLSYRLEVCVMDFFEGNIPLNEVGPCISTP